MTHTTILGRVHPKRVLCISRGKLHRKTLTEIEVVEPPSFLVNQSFDFFGNSPLNLGVYATSLGYLDMCVGSYSVTETGSTTADWLISYSQDLYLITIEEGYDESLFATFTKNTGTIFQAFKPKVWTFVRCFVIPMFGLLMVTTKEPNGVPLFRLMKTSWRKMTKREKS
jgi:hypothetical protein